MTKRKARTRAALPFTMPLLRAWVRKQLPQKKYVPPPDQRDEFVRTLSSHAPASFGQRVEPNFIEDAIEDLIRTGVARVRSRC